MAGVTEKQIKDLAHSIDYRDGYILRIDGKKARWEVTSPDNYHRYDSVTVLWDWFSLDGCDEDAALRMIFFYLAYAEDHEMRERFKVHGKSIYNPHRYGAQMSIKHTLPEDYLYRDLSITFDGDNLR